FFSYETSRGSQRTQNLTPTVPLVAWRQGDFSRLPVTIHDPRTGLPFPDNVIPPDRINRVSQKIQERFYPLPNAGNPDVLGTRNYLNAKTRPYHPATYWTTRSHHRLSENHRVLLRLQSQPISHRPYNR